MTIREARAAGRAWTDREWDALTDTDDADPRWLASDNDAYPLIEDARGSARRAALAAAANAAARARWTALYDAADEAAAKAQAEDE